MISGAAKDSEPHRVSSRGASASIKRDRPKSVSLIRGPDGIIDRRFELSRWGIRGWVSRISIDQFPSPYDLVSRVKGALKG